MIGRALLLAAAVVGAGLYSSRVTGPEATLARTPLAALPASFGMWSSAGDVPIDAASLEVLRADDYLNRTYVGPGGRRVNLYVGYWASQRQGDAIHSPRNCLPGSGWQPVESSRVSLDVGDSRIAAERYLIERGGERQLAYYWYQGRGRVTAGEYANKFWLIVDAARLHRSNGALVRVMAPVDGTERVDATLAGFVQQLFPRLGSSLP